MKGDDGETIQRTTDDNWDEIERISALLTAHSNNEEPGTIPYLLEDGLAVLVPRGLEGKLDSALRGHDVACGLGKERPLVEAAISLREARLALLSSAALHTGKMVHYSDLGAEQVVLLLYQDSRGELESFVQQTLGPLLEHDSGVSTPLLPTVSLFARHGWRIGEAASDEQLHKNTLVYRLDRAARILGLDLKQPESRLTVQLALWALPLVREYDCPS